MIKNIDGMVLQMGERVCSPFWALPRLAGDGISADHRSPFHHFISQSGFSPPRPPFIHDAQSQIESDCDGCKLCDATHLPIFKFRSFGDQLEACKERQNVVQQNGHTCFAAWYTYSTSLNVIKKKNPLTPQFCLFSSNPLCPPLRRLTSRLLAS